MASVFLEGEAVEVGNIFCIGRNYAAHVEELKNEIPSEPVVFMKPSGSILNSGGTILLPEFSRDVQFECELVLLITGIQTARARAKIFWDAWRGTAWVWI